MFVKTRCLRGGTLSEAGTPGNELIKKPMELPPSSLRVRRAGVAAAAAARSRGTRCCLVNHQQICDLIASQGKSPSVKALTHSDFISFTSRLLLGQPQRPFHFFFFSLTPKYSRLHHSSAAFLPPCVCGVCVGCVVCASIPPSSRVCPAAGSRQHLRRLLAFPARHPRALGSPRSSLFPRSAAPRT